MGARILTYIGTVLIAFEFVRKFTDFQALAAMTIGYPFLLVNGNWERLTKKFSLLNGLLFLLLVIGAICFLVVMIPFTLFFYALWFIILILESFHRWVNHLYSREWRLYSAIAKPWIRLSLLSHGKRDDHRTQQRVLEKLEKREVPILPIIGLILLTIAFILELTS